MSSKQNMAVWATMHCLKFDILIRLLSLCLLLLMMTPIYICAQRPSFGKLSPLVREAYLSTVAPSSVSAAKAIKPGKTPVLTAFVKTTSPVEALRQGGCKVLAKFGNLYVVSMPLGLIAPLSRLPEVTRIEAGRRASVTMDTTNIIIGSAAVHSGLNFPHAYTGSGVVVGVEDIGFDLTHPTFFSQDMSRYRIKAMWDQLTPDTVGSLLPVGRDYRDSVSLLKIGHPYDGLRQTHGTHTAGIAAGSGTEGVDNEYLGRYAGVAPDADICLVCNATSDDAELIAPEDQYKYTFALDALGFKYIFDYADSVGKPCVINFSEGSLEDFHGYDALYYEMLDSLIGPGHIIVSSAGNEGNRVNYVHKQKDEQNVEIAVTSNWHQRTLSFTSRSTDDYTLRFQCDGGTKDIPLDSVLLSSDSTYADSMLVRGLKYKIVATAYTDCYDSSHIVTDWLISSEYYISPSNLTFNVAGDDADVEIYRGSGSLTSASGDNTHSILSPGSAPGVICVGMTGYRQRFVNYLGNVMDFDGSSNGKIQRNSSIGPTYDGRIKPDVVAPGQNIVSAYSSFYLENNPNASDINSDVRHFQYNGRTYVWNSNMGTSMSSPVVAGVIALWLQANPRLTPRDCLDIISKTSTHYDESLTYPNNTYGYGQIDAEAGLKLILEQITGIKNIRSDKDNDRIYTIDGRYVGKDFNRLPHGIYIKGNKKILR